MARDRFINPLNMEELKLYGKLYDQIETFVETVHTVSNDIGMEFGIEKCGMLLLKRGKVVSSEEVSLPDWQVTKEIDDTGYKHLGILEYDKLKEKKIKECICNRSTNEEISVEVKVKWKK